MKFEKAFTAYTLFVFVLMVAGVGGWIANIVKLTDMAFDPLTGMVVLRFIGIFVAPLGAVLGFI